MQWESALAYLTDEDDRVDAVERRRRSRDLPSDPIGADVERELRIGIALTGGLSQDLSDIEESSFDQVI